MGNPFLSKLLTLQQDGAGAINCPSRWDIPPLLEVETPVDRLIESVASEIGGVGETGVWCFLVGSPGNGKSAAVGRLVRSLLKLGFVVQTPEGRKLSELKHGDIPYLLEVIKPGEKFSRAWIAQDASVVPDPYALDIDPAKELLELARDAWERGVSLVVCTNRGVIENADRMLECDKGSADWTKAIGNAASAQPAKLAIPSSGKKNAVHAHLRVEVERLDHETLLQTNGATSILEKLVESACHEDNWLNCIGCQARDLCPFSENRKWLMDAGGRSSFLDLLRRAELLSGQNIVLREALALLSLILSGCPRDYSEQGPCHWVKTKVSEEDLFSLIGRRIYLLLYSSDSPLGLERNSELRSLQLETLEEVANEMAGDGEWKHAKGILEKLLAATKQLSTDVGVGRIIGKRGMLGRLDCLNDPLPPEFADRWSPERHLDDSPLSGNLEILAQNAWCAIGVHIENQRESLGKQYHWFSRWASAISYRFGALAEGRTAFDSEFQALEKIFDVGETPERLMNVQSQLGSMLGSANSEGIALTANVRLSNRWTDRYMRPKLKPKMQKGIPRLLVQLGEETEVEIGTETLLWLIRRHGLHLIDATFPRHYLQSIQDVLVEAASRSNYDMSEEVELTVASREGKRFQIKKMDEYVGVIREDQSGH